MPGELIGCTYLLLWRRLIAFDEPRGCAFAKLLVGPRRASHRHPAAAGWSRCRWSWMKQSLNRPRPEGSAIRPQCARQWCFGLEPRTIYLGWGRRYESYLDGALHAKGYFYFACWVWEYSCISQNCHNFDSITRDKLQISKSITTQYATSYFGYPAFWVES